MSDSQSGGPGFQSHSDHYQDLFLSIPEFKSSATLVNNQLVCLQPVGILKNVCLLGSASTCAIKKHVRGFRLVKQFETVTPPTIVLE